MHCGDREGRRGGNLVAGVTFRVYLGLHGCRYEFDSLSNFRILQVVLLGLRGAVE